MGKDRSPGLKVNWTLPGGLGEKEPLMKGASEESIKILVKVAENEGTEYFPTFLSGAKAVEKAIGVKGLRSFRMELIRKKWPSDQTIVSQPNNFSFNKTYPILEETDSCFLESSKGPPEGGRGGVPPPGPTGKGPGEEEERRAPAKREGAAREVRSELVEVRVLLEVVEVDQFFGAGENAEPGGEIFDSDEEEGEEGRDWAGLEGD